jgi:FkbM family methyltransferase
MPRQLFMILQSLKAHLVRLLCGDPNRFLRRARGVIHVGANTGQEAELYHSHHLHVLWIEPIPSVFQELVVNIREYPDQKAIQALVTDVEGKAYDFHIASNNGQSSSILQLEQHRGIWPDITYTETLRLVSRTLPTLLETHAVDLGLHDALILDTQGSELLVLRGALPVLDKFRYIKVEVPNFESYKGCCRVSDIDALLTPFGFEEIARTKFASHPEGGSYFDVVYEARRP